MIGQSFVFFLLALFFIFLQGIFSGLETGMVSVLRPRAEHAARKGSRRAKILLFFQHNSSIMISTALIAVNISVVLGSLMVKKFMESMKWDSGTALFISSVVLSILFLITEIVPKNWFREASFERCTRFIYLFQAAYCILYVPVHVFSRFTESLTAFAEVIRRKKNASANPDPLHSETAENRKKSSPGKKDFRLYLYESQESGTVDSATASILDRAVDVPGMMIETVMIPARKVTDIPAGMTIREAFRLSLTTGKTRFAVYTGSGKLKRWTAVFDVYEAIFNIDEKNWDTMPVISCIKKLHTISSGLTLGSLLRRLKAERVLMFAVEDDMGNQLGLIRPADVALQLFGQKMTDLNVPRGKMEKGS